ncbi:MAG: hypothetical protein ACK5FQ_08860, partial [Betaproteobacteria bacterium]
MALPRQFRRLRLGLVGFGDVARRSLELLLSRPSQQHGPRLIVVGRPSIEAVQKQAVAAGVKDLVIACGSTNEIAHYHAAADAFV